VRITDHERDKEIAEAYASGDFTTIHIASTFGLSRRRVQQIAKDYGVVRTRAEGNRVATPLKSRRRLRLR
jgi:DNA-binding transcriptional regulator LsrR (DeoR family)